MKGLRSCTNGYNFGGHIVNDSGETVVNGSNTDVLVKKIKNFNNSILTRTFIRVPNHTTKTTPQTSM